MRVNRRVHPFPRHPLGSAVPAGQYRSPTPHSRFAESPTGTAGPIRRVRHGGFTRNLRAARHRAAAVGRISSRRGRGEPRDLESGDLVFFKTVSRGPSHVGIIIGDDQFIARPSSGCGARRRLSASAGQPSSPGAASTDSRASAQEAHIWRRRSAGIRQRSLPRRGQASRNCGNSFPAPDSSSTIAGNRCRSALPRAGAARSSRWCSTRDGSGSSSSKAWRSMTQRVVLKALAARCARSAWTSARRSWTIPTSAG